MGRLSAKLRSVGGGIGFWCPGCDQPHVVATGASGWSWDGNVDAPTISPSILVTSGHHSPGFRAGDGCWCSFNEKRVAEGKEPSSFNCERCHSFVKAGQIQFLGDCSHKLAGQTVPIPDWPYAEGEYGGV